MIVINKLSDITKYIKNVDVVIFDLDDTLYSEKEYIKSGFNAISKKFKNFKEIELKLWNDFVDGKKAIDELIKNQKLKCTKKELLDIYRFHSPKIHLYKDAKIVLDKIKLNKKIAIITDGDVKRQKLKIKALNIKVDKIIITDSLGGIQYRKPCTAAFIKMKKHFDVPYEKMVYIGDNIFKDFIAPQKLGMKCIYFKNHDGLYV